MDISLLVKLTTRAWCLDILTHLHAGVAGRQAPLLAASGAGRTAFGQSMTHLIDLGLVARNPGHGHPLRPEFRLTVLGEPVAKLAYDVTLAVPEPSDLSVLRRRWTVPVLSVVQAPRRFSQIKLELGLITDRALSQTVDQLQHHGWLLREVDVAARPLRPLYSATNAGQAISRIVQSAR